MPRYHFNVVDGRDMPDLDGHELPDLESARNEAVVFAGALLKDHGQKFLDRADLAHGRDRRHRARSFPVGVHRRPEPRYSGKPLVASFLDAQRLLVRSSGFAEGGASAALVQPLSGEGQRGSEDRPAGFVADRGDEGVTVTVGKLVTRDFWQHADSLGPRRLVAVQFGPFAVDGGTLTIVDIEEVARYFGSAWAGKMQTRVARQSRDFPG